MTEREMLLAQQEEIERLRSQLALANMALMDIGFRMPCHECPFSSDGNGKRKCSEVNLGCAVNFAYLSKYEIGDMSGGNEIWLADLLDTLEKYEASHPYPAARKDDA